MSGKPQVEITGLEAKFYDFLLNMVLLGQYDPFIKKVIHHLRLNPDDIVMDLGAGTGKNADLMLQYMNEHGKIYAIEIGEEMRKQLNHRQKSDSRIRVVHQRIEEKFILPELATVAFISFVMHGLEQPDRLKAIDNVYSNLSGLGRFCILDYNHFNVDHAPWYVKLAVRRLECKPTESFIQKDWQSLLQKKGFSEFTTVTYFRNYIRLLCCVKTVTE
ncbi:MAG: class I SAM-dependent methyltransferase [Calditrichaeota bacterium]|nr:class I SAM-dependent methyltransferase [Calditrichota bacterium]